MRNLSVIKDILPGRTATAPVPTRSPHTLKTTHAPLVTRGPDTTPLLTERHPYIPRDQGATPSHTLHSLWSPASQSRCNLHTRTSMATPSPRLPLKWPTWEARRPLRMGSTWDSLLLQVGTTHTFPLNNSCNLSPNTGSPPTSNIPGTPGLNSKWESLPTTKATCP